MQTMWQFSLQQYDTVSFILAERDSETEFFNSMIQDSDAGVWLTDIILFFWTSSIV